MFINVTRVTLLRGHGTSASHALKDIWNSSVLTWVWKVRDAVVASPHRLPIFSTSARRDMLLSAIGRLLLLALDFGTVYLLTSGLTRHLQHIVGSW